MQIITLRADDHALLIAAATLLVECFREHWPTAWPDLDTALEELHELVAPEAICRAALDDNGALLGWIGGQPAYNGTVWELHPLAVQPAHQGRKIGRALVADFEAQVAARGGLTITLGTDDEAGLICIQIRLRISRRSAT
jgi:aminoglycoside 6'-N-acetyltransferase I